MAGLRVEGTPSSPPSGPVRLPLAPLAMPPAEILEIALRSLAVAGGPPSSPPSSGCPSASGSPCGGGGVWGRVLLYSGLALPSVVVGLLFYLLLSRSGPLGFLNLLYTPWAMVLAEATLAFP